MDTALLQRRKIDFYIKGLPLDTRIELFKKMVAINPLSVEHLLEKPKGYPYFRQISYTEKAIEDYIQRMKVLFDNANNFMIMNNRPPLFSDTNDSYKSATEYVDIMSKRPLPELEEYFDCRFQDYQPPVLQDF